MAKEFKDWVDEFVGHGANPKNVPNWPEEAGGTRVVNELPQVGEEHTIYELHTTTPSKFNYVPCITEMEFRYVFENEEAFRDFAMNVASHYNNHNEFYCYCLAEDELIRVYYNSGSAYWTLFDNEEENVFIYNNQRVCICKAIIDEHTALLLNGKQVPIGDSDGILYSPILIHQVKSKVLCYEYKFGMVFPIMNSTLPSCIDGVPSVFFAELCTDINSGIVQWVTNDGSIKVALPYVDGKYRYDKNEQYFYDIKTGEYYTGEFEWVDIDDFNFKDYVDYETYDSIPLGEGQMDKPFIFDPSGKSITSYWIYINNEWINLEEIGKFETQEKIISPSINTQEITPDEGYDGLSKVTVDAVTRTIDSSIKAENIKKNVTILGVNGTYEGVTYNVTKSYAYFPENLASMGVAQIGSNVYLFGGNGTNGANEIIYKFNAKAETINALSATLPQALHSMGVAQIGSNVYLFGGCNDSSDDVNTIYKFNAKTETISTLSVTLPQTLYNMSVAQMGSSVYLFGGHSEYNDVNTIYKFDTDTETISTLSVTLPQALSGMGVAQIGSNVYLFGGNDGNGASVNTIYRFDTETETIDTLLMRLPRLLCAMGVATFGSNIYLFGGLSTKAVNTIYKFNAETGRISSLSVTLPKAFFKMGAAQIGNNVYLFGGLETSISKLHNIYKFNVSF